MGRALLLVFLTLIATLGCSQSNELLPRGPSEPVTQGAPGTEPASPSNRLPSIGRLVVREAELLVWCDDYLGVAREIQEVVTKFGGYVVESDVVDLRDGSGPRQASLTVMVPADELEHFLTAVAEQPSVSRVASERVRSSDVTEETLDLAARRRTLERTEARLQALLERAQTIDEILRLEQELTRVRTEIEQIVERQRFLERRIQYAEVRLLLVPTPRLGEPGFLETFQEAWSASLFFLRVVIRGTLWAIVLTWWIWGTLLVMAALLLLWWRRRPSRRTLPA